MKVYLSFRGWACYGLRTVRAWQQDGGILCNQSQRAHGLVSHSLHIVCYDSILPTPRRVSVRLLVGVAKQNEHLHISLLWLNPTNLLPLVPPWPKWHHQQSNCEHRWMCSTKNMWITKVLNCAVWFWNAILMDRIPRAPLHIRRLSHWNPQSYSLHRALPITSGSDGMGLLETCRLQVQGRTFLKHCAATDSPEASTH